MTGATGRRARSINAQVGLALLLARETKQITREGLADALGVTAGDIEEMEAGRRELEAYELLVAASVLDLPVSYFFEGIEAPDPEDAPDQPRLTPRTGPAWSAANDNALRSV